MKQHKEMEEPNLTVAFPSRSYHSGPSETVTLKASDLEGSIPREHLLRPLPAGQVVVLPASEIFVGNVPKISLALLARLLPGIVAPAETVIALPASKVAVAYGLAGGDAVASGLQTSPESGPDASGGGADSLPVRKHGFFSALPIFRRKGAPGPHPAGDPEPIRTENEQVPEPPSAATTDPLSGPGGTAQPGLQIGSVAEEALQALLLVDENLFPERVIELCGALPGIRSCVLMRGPAILAAHAVPEGLDPAPIGAGAAGLFWSVGESAAHMGVGTVESVTLFTAGRGALSLLQAGGLTMIVLHMDRGFTPGVREKLAAVLHELARGVSVPEA